MKNNLQGYTEMETLFENNHTKKLVMFFWNSVKRSNFITPMYAEDFDNF